MFDFKNNDISTVLLLIVLGLLIWYLTKPCKEKFTDNATNETQSPQQMQKPAIVQQIAQVLQQMVPQNNETQKQTELTQQIAAAQEAAFAQKQAELTQQQVAAQQAAAQQFAAQQAAAQQAATQQAAAQLTTRPPVVQQQKQMAPTQNVNTFLPFDADYNNGADIESAFQNNVDASKNVISAVDINKQNVKDYDAKDFLPKEINDQWFDTDFSQAKTNINDDKLINTERYVIGINTVGQSLKNASYDIRGTIANPKFSVSPWNNSTYEPDYNIKPLC
jgi:hypothetical protein